MRKQLAITLALVSWIGASAANAETPRCYTAASVQGSWAVVGTYGANVAEAFGTRAVEENGNFTSTYVLNGPTSGSTTGARTITTGTQMGTYTVNCDGTGVVTRFLTSSTGVTVTQMDDFVITRADLKGGKLIALAISDAQRTPSALVSGGIFVTRVHTRLPEADQHER